jgi:hypothetical protein
MRFDLRKPCPQCPFRPSAGGYLHPERAREIALAVTEGNVTFTCHKTISGEIDDEDEGIYRPGFGDQMCAGAMAFIEKCGAPNQMLQIAERLGLRDPDRLLPAALDDIYGSVDEMAAGHAAGR